MTVAGSGVSVAAEAVKKQAEKYWFIDFISGVSVRGSVYIPACVFWRREVFGISRILILNQIVTVAR